MRTVWQADPTHHPFVVAGGGTIGMESVATNLVAPGHTVLVVNTGYFGDRMAEMLRRRGANVLQVGAALGEVVPPDAVRTAVEAHRPHALFATHVDTSTGARLDVEGICHAIADHDVLTVFDGICATAAERFAQAAWGADVYLTASQKAIGLPAGLALWVASERALAARRSLATAPPMSLDWLEWKPVMEAYEHETNAYFSTPPTTLIPALDVALQELVDEGMEAVFTRHATAGQRMRAAFTALGLTSLTSSPAETLSALLWPDGVVPADGLAAIREAGAVVAGGLHPLRKADYFRVGHMGVTTKRPDDLRRTVEAVGEGLRVAGGAVDVQAGLAAFDAVG
jgi:alanine-glyoxylate transaminase/serine-glyoxylate transaminase/serine-pyruvate transaminase